MATSIFLVQHDKGGMSVTRILSIVALLLAVFSVLFQGFPLLLVSVILLAVVEIVRG